MCFFLWLSCFTGAILFLNLLVFLALFCETESERVGREKRKRNIKRNIKGGLNLFLHKMSSWFSSASDKGTRLSNYSSHPIRIVPGSEGVFPTDVAGPEYEDSKTWDEDYLGYDDPGMWYEEPDVILGALSLAGAIVLLILVLVSVKYRKR